MPGWRSGWGLTSLEKWYGPEEPPSQSTSWLPPGGWITWSGDEILLTTMEHHSNIVPWQLVARRTGARLRYLEMDDEGRLKLDGLDELLTSRTRMVAMTHISNALGTINPMARITEAAQPRGAWFWSTALKPCPT